MSKNAIDKWQYGDFQTPLELAQKIVKRLKYNHGIDPNIIIEPTCGQGAFIQAALEAFQHSKILGFEMLDLILVQNVRYYVPYSIIDSIFLLFVVAT